jgi:glucose/arabinose dehydrogenase
VVSTTVDLAEVLNDQAFIGFTGATGGLNNVHELLDWEFSSNSQLLPAPPMPVALSTETVVSGLTIPTAIDWSPDGTVLYVSEQSGIIKAYRDGVESTFIDFTAEVNGTRDRGLLDIAVHPDFDTNPYVYLLYTYDPPEVFDNLNDPLAGPDDNGNQAGRLTRVTADAATNYTTFVSGSEVTLLGKNSTWNNFNAFVNSTNDFTEAPAGINPDGSSVQDFIASDSESHTVGAVEFGPDGALYVTIGDGASYNQRDARAVRVQDIDNLSGKVLRIDALNGDGLADNPFYDGDADSNRSKVAANLRLVFMESG